MSVHVHIFASVRVFCMRAHVCVYKGGSSVFLGRGIRLFICLPA